MTNTQEELGRRRDRKVFLLSGLVAALGLGLGIVTAFSDVASGQRDTVAVYGRAPAAIAEKVIPGAIASGMSEFMEFASLAAGVALIGAGRARKTRKLFWAVYGGTGLGAKAASAFCLYQGNGWPIARAALRAWEPYAIMAALTVVVAFVSLVGIAVAGWQRPSRGEMVLPAAVLVLASVCAMAAKQKMGEPGTWNVNHEYEEMMFCETRHEAESALCSCLASAISKQWPSPRAYALARDRADFENVIRPLMMRCKR